MRMWGRVAAAADQVRDTAGAVRPRLDLLTVAMVVIALSAVAAAVALWVNR